jgi:hypothetical protein
MEATMRRLLLSLALALTLSAVGASSALAEAPEGAQKAPLFGPEPFLPGVITCEGGGAPTPNTFGFAVLNTPGDETTLSGEVALKHAAANETYAVGIIQGSGLLCGFRLIGTMTTNEKGNGNLDFAISRGGGTKFTVEVGAEERLERFASPAVELD